ncbi:hypothetical protein AK830_g10533 [Neonectria ditissima]|uniref:CBM-cenC domain-containing protein n=1 Tax=Neonectria ditissima TaxID=78410 RepID=A0A0P7APT5_9HYPO|nr:hypothetical protein AK830_g10533 [Neonectria ditissima]
MAIIKVFAAFAALNFLGANAGPCKPALSTPTTTISSSTSSTSSPLSTCTVDASNKSTSSSFEEADGWNFSTNGNAAIEVENTDEARCGERAVVARIRSTTGTAGFQQTPLNLEENIEYLLSYYWALSASQTIQPGDCIIEHFISDQSFRTNSLTATGPGYHQYTAILVRAASDPNPTLQIRLACRGASEPKLFYIDDVTFTPQAPR